VAARNRLGLTGLDLQAVLEDYDFLSDFELNLKNYYFARAF
jgi:hypothetical protein